MEVAAPKAVTGHSALVGIYKAYEVNGEELDPERTDVANDELTVATELADGGVEDAKVSELLTEIKKQIAEQNPASREEVEQIVEEQLSKLDIDFSKWSTQLEDLSKTIEDKIGKVVNDEGFWESVKTFFRNLADTVRGWLN